MTVATVLSLRTGFGILHFQLPRQPCYNFGLKTVTAILSEGYTNYSSHLRQLRKEEMKEQERRSRSQREDSTDENMDEREGTKFYVKPLQPSPSTMDIDSAI